MTLATTSETLDCQVQSDGSSSGLTLIAAARYALLHHPSLLSQQVQVEIENGARVVASGQFDGTFQSSLSQSDTTSAVGTESTNSGGLSVLQENLTQTNFTAGYTELYRNGISVAPTYQANRSVSDYLGPGGLDTSSLGLSVTLPLLRARGRAAVAAVEDAAKEEVTAASLDLDQEVAQIVSNVAVSYWRLLAAKQFLEVAIVEEQHAKTYVDNSKVLVEADQVPRNDLHEVVANLALLTSQRVSAESAVVSARLQLASDMGISAEEMLKTEASPSDPFPQSDSQATQADSPASLSYYVGQATSRRSDYLAAKRRVEEQKVLLGGARNKLLPQLDFAVSGGYAQAQPGTNVGQLLSVPASRVIGPNVTGSLTFSLPIQNRAAKGGAIEAAGALKQASLNAEIVARNIIQSVGVAVEQVRSADLRVQQSNAAVDEFVTSLAGVRDKYNLGLGSIVEILTIEDRLTSAKNSLIQAQLDYAIALTQLRLATGTLVGGSPSSRYIPSSAFVTLPSPKN